MTIEEIRSIMKWWESKRWIYNLSVGLFGIFAIYGGLSGNTYSWTAADTYGIIWWGVGANIFYSLGILLELLDWYYLKSNAGIKNFRTLLFVIGILFSCFWTFWCGMIYFTKPHLW